MADARAAFEQLPQAVRQATEASMGELWDEATWADRLQEGESISDLAYLREQGISDLIDCAIQELAQKKPADVRKWLSQHFRCEEADYPPEALSSVVSARPFWMRDGYGDGLYNSPEIGAVWGLSGLAGSEPPAELMQGGSVLAGLLSDNSGLWQRAARVVTTKGVTLAMCVKTGVDQAVTARGAPPPPLLAPPAGMVAGDEGCYEAFREIFYPALLRLNNVTDVSHPTSAPCEVQSLDLSCVLSVRAEVAMNVKDRVFCSAIGFEDRRKLEDLVIKTLKPIFNTYYRLDGSRSALEPEAGSSVAPRFLFGPPESVAELSAGVGRHWPDARGLFHGEIETEAGTGQFAVWVNQHDHLRVVCDEAGRGKLREVTMRALAVARQIEEAKELPLAWNTHRGHATTCPSMAGSGLRVTCRVQLPLTGASAGRLQALGLQAKSVKGQAGVWDVSNRRTLGASPETIVNELVDGIKQLAAA